MNKEQESLQPGSQEQETMKASISGLVPGILQKQNPL
jgi:hypothetical protein